MRLLFLSLAALLLAVAGGGRDFVLAQAQVQSPTREPATNAMPGQATTTAPDSGLFGEISAPVPLDRVVAVVNGHPFTASEVREEQQLAQLSPGSQAEDKIGPAAALGQLISRSLIQQQIRRQEADAAEPTATEIATRLAELRRSLPLCQRLNCAADSVWQQLLSSHGLSQSQVEDYLRHQMQMLRFIELRFRPGILIDEVEIGLYYRQHLLPAYSPGATVPSLTEVSPRIEEILLEQRVNALLEDWLKELRQQGDVEILDPAYEEPAASATPTPAHAAATPAATGSEAAPNPAPVAAPAPAKSTPQPPAAAPAPPEEAR